MGCNSSAVAPNTLPNNSAFKKNAVAPEPPNDSGLVYFEENKSAENLFIACKKGKINNVKDIIQYCDVNAKGMWMNTPLIVACQYNHGDIAMVLLETPHIDFQYQNDKGASAILYACLEGMVDVVARLIDLGVKVDTPAALIYNTSTDKNDYYTPLSIAVVNGHTSIVNLLISADTGLIYEKYSLSASTIFPNSSGTKTIRDVTCFMLACRYGWRDVLQILIRQVRLKEGISGCEKWLLMLDSYSQGLLHYLAYFIDHSHTCGVRDLMHELNSVNTTLLHQMIYVENVEGNNVLHVACDKKNFVLLQSLLDLERAHGRVMNLDVMNGSGATPLYLSVKRRHEDMITLLLENQADPFVMCKSNDNMLPGAGGNEVEISCVDEAMKLPKSSKVHKIFVAIKEGRQDMSQSTTQPHMSSLQNQRAVGGGSRSFANIHDIPLPIDIDIPAEAAKEDYVRGPSSVVQGAEQDGGGGDISSPTTHLPYEDSDVRAASPVSRSSASSKLQFTPVHVPVPSTPLVTNTSKMRSVHNSKSIEVTSYVIDISTASASARIVQARSPRVDDITPAGAGGGEGSAHLDSTRRALFDEDDDGMDVGGGKR